jgi:hypothetical protein
MKTPAASATVTPTTAEPASAASRRLSVSEAPLRASASAAAGFARPAMDRDAIARQLRVSLALASLLSAGCLFALLTAWAPLV